LLGGVFNDRRPATNLSLGTSPNYRYRAWYCQAPILILISKMRFAGVNNRQQMDNASSLSLAMAMDDVKGPKSAPVVSFSQSVV
jgi:hypothetical protein